MKKKTIKMNNKTISKREFYFKIVSKKRAAF